MRAPKYPQNSIGSSTEPRNTASTRSIYCNKPEILRVHGVPTVFSRTYVALVPSRGWTLRIPAKNGYPPIFGARTLPYPPRNTILTTGYPGTRFFAAYPAKFLKFFLHISVPQKANFKWRLVCSTVFLPKRGVRTVSMTASIHKPPKIVVSSIT